MITLDWSTPETSGAIGAGDLTELAISFTIVDSFDGPWTWSETIITGGAAQPIGGVARTVADIAFEFDLDTLTIARFDNDLDLVQQDDGTGVTYNVYFRDIAVPGAMDRAYVDLYVDGVYETYIGGETEDEQIWSQSTSPVPLPAGLALLPLGLVGLAALRRRG